MLSNCKCAFIHTLNCAVSVSSEVLVEERGGGERESEKERERTSQECMCCVFDVHRPQSL